MKKVLFVATVDSHIELFHLPYLKMFHDKGWEVHVATDTGKKIKYCDKKIKLPIKRSPFKLVSNYKAMRKLREVMEKERYSIVHCHTPMGGVVARMAGRKFRRQGQRMIYTAHGFHFYKGAPMHYWMMFYPVEWYLAKYTDTLITINNEDYERAKKKFGKRCRDIQYVPGVGVDPKKFEKKLSIKEKHALRESLGLKDDDKVLICVGRLDKNKNQGFLIRAMKELVTKDKRYQLLLVGPDELNGKYQKLAEKLGVAGNVHFLGFRKDISELMQISDVAVSASKREGLPVNLIEAAMLGLPIVATDCRGNRDVCEKCGGRVCSIENISRFVNDIRKAKKDIKRGGLIEEYEFSHVEERMLAIYFRKKRVLHVLASNKFSGAENVACTIIRNMSDDFEMAYCSPKGPIRKTLDEMGIRYYGIEGLNYRNLKEVVKGFNPDIIHAHDFRASIFANRFSRSKIMISHIHQDNPIVRRLTPKSLLYKYASRKFYRIILASKASLDNFYYKDYIKGKSIVLRNVVDQRYIQEKAKEYIVEEDFDVIFLGRLISLKNPVRALDIIRHIKEKKCDVKMAIVGDGEERDAVKRSIAEYNLKKNVKMFGFVENPYPILAKSKVLLITSEREGTPMAVLEAQALGKKVVSTKIIGFEEIIENGTSGFLSDDNRVLAKKILFFLEKVESTDRAADDFAKRNDLNNYLNVIREVYSVMNEEETR